VSAVAIAAAPVVVVAVPVMGIRRAGILATVRGRVLSPAIVGATCRRMTRRAVDSCVCPSSILGGGRVSSTQ
jgi:hypothetical protein